MLTELISVLICLWLAAKVLGKKHAVEAESSPCVLAKRSLRWGALVVTVSLLGYFGINRYMHGMVMTSVFSFVLCTGVTALLMMGMRIELMGNVLIDCLLLSAGFVAACFTVVNGVPVVLGLLNARNLGIWSLFCIGVAFVVRTIFWINEGK